MFRPFEIITTMLKLHQELKDAENTLKPCSCGSRCLIRYEPGCTKVVCIKEMKILVALPDWCPHDAATAHNHRTAQ